MSQTPAGQEDSVLAIMYSWLNLTVCVDATASGPLLSDTGTVVPRDQMNRRSSLTVVRYLFQQSLLYKLLPRTSCRHLSLQFCHQQTVFFFFMQKVNIHLSHLVFSVISLCIIEGRVKTCTDECWWKLRLTDTTNKNGGCSITLQDTPSEVSLNFSLLFFFRHFHGLKILPRLENLPLRFGGGVLPPVLPPSPTFVLWCCSASSSKNRKVSFNINPIALTRLV